MWPHLSRESSHQDSLAGLVSQQNPSEYLVKFKKRLGEVCTLSHSAMHCNVSRFKQLNPIITYEVQSVLYLLQEGDSQ